MRVGETYQFRLSAKDERDNYMELLVEEIPSIRAKPAVFLLFFFRLQLFSRDLYPPFLSGKRAWKEIRSRGEFRYEAVRR